MSYTQLKGFDSLSDKSPSDVVGDNIIQFLDWGFLDKGGFFNVVSPTSGLYAGDKSVLKLRDDPRFDEGQVWGSFTKGWVWESGLSNSQPISISGVTVNNTFYPSNTAGNYAHYYDYINGQVVFSSGLATSSTVKLNYSYKYINIVHDKEYNFFRRIQEEVYRNDNVHNSQVGSGVWNNLAETRVQMPVISIEPTPIKSTKPYCLGAGMRYATITLSCHILTEDYATNAKIADILTDQEEKTIFAFDSNMIAQSGAFPLDYRGMVQTNAKTYPQLVAESINGGFRYNKIRIADTNSNEIQQIGNIFLSTVKLNTEILLGRL